MMYVVNDNCVGCGLCEATCPKVFSLNAEGTAVAIEDDVPEENRSSAAEAKEGCPVCAIEEA